MTVVTLYVHLYVVFLPVWWPRHCRGHNTARRIKQKPTGCSAKWHNASCWEKW